MILIDVNVLIYAHRPESPDHNRYRDWLDNVITHENYGVYELILSAFIRMVTNRRIFKQPTPVEIAVEFTQRFRAGPGAIRIVPTASRWETFVSICHSIGATGNLVPDAFLAATAIDARCEWITTDRDFSRFPGVQWRRPFQ